MSLEINIPQQWPDWMLTVGLYLLAALVGAVVGAVALVGAYKSLTLGLVFLMLLVGLAGLLAIGQIQRPLLALLAFTLPLHIDASYMFLPINHAAGPAAFRVTAADLILFLLIFLWFSEIALNRRRQIRLFPKATVPAVAFIVVGFTSSLFARNLLLTEFQLFEFIKGFLLYLYIANRVENQDDAKWVLVGLMAAILFQGGLGLYQGATGGKRLGLVFLGEQNLDNLDAAVDIVITRPSGTLYHSNQYSMYLGMMLPIIAAVLLTPAHRIFKLSAAVATLVGLGAVLYTLSRGAWIGLFISAIALIAYGLKRRVVQWFHIGLGLFGLLIIALIFNFATGGAMVERFDSDDGGSAASRVPLMKGALIIIADYPFFGSGLNNYQHTIAVYDPSGKYTHGGYLPVVHNAFLLLGAETGLLGLGTFIWLLGVLISHGLAFIKPYEISLATGATVGLLGSVQHIITHNMVDFGLVADPQLFVMFWFLAGLMMALTYRPPIENTAKNDTLRSHPLWRLYHHA